MGTKGKEMKKVEITIQKIYKYIYSTTCYDVTEIS